ncbi:pyridoxamine 5'-phosphate oxidase family protein [Streptomyces sp. NPDC057287]|uniref:pyridoxamine 5'-phosphate oxidase family protein n=1 Tax=Streptomyces sp. NPDC057287 TaxID=3346086 RepID=UPI00362AC257
MLSSRPSDTGTATGSGPSDAGTAAGSGPSGPPASSVAEKLRAIELLGSVRYGRLAMSMRALPFLAVARHLVVEGGVILRMHRGLGFHESCDGSVVAYGADNFNSPAPVGGEDLWSVQFTGPAELVHPAPEQRERFGTGPSAVNGEHFDPVYLRLDPRLSHMHTLAFDAST